MLANANVTVGRDEVIANLGKGYHLADWLVIEEHDSTHEAHKGVSELPRPTFVASTDVTASNGDVPLTERQLWILAQLREKGQITRMVVEKQFDIGDKQAKRELSGLTSRGMMEFVRKPRPGYYVLRTRAASKAKTMR
jgi:predicted HTH transcriptional regulator